MSSQSANDASKIENNNPGKESEDTTGSNKIFFRKNNKGTNHTTSSRQRKFKGETLDMNGQLFQTTEESRDAVSKNHRSS